MQNIYNFFLKRYLNTDYPEYFRARLILQFCLITALFSLFYTVIANLINFQASARIMPTMALIFAALAFMMRINVNAVIIANAYLVFSSISAALLISQSGMIHSGIVPWLAFIPMAANLLIGKKMAYFWLSVCFLIVFGLMFLSPDRAVENLRYAPAFDKYFLAIVYNGLTAIILALSMIYQNSMNKYASLLHNKNQEISSINTELKAKNDEIVAQNEELIQQKEEILSQREYIEIKNKELLSVQEDLNFIIDKLTLTQSTLANREAEKRSILEAIYSTQLLVAELDVKGRFLNINNAASEILNIEPAQITGKHFVHLRDNFKVAFEGHISLPGLWKKVLKGQHTSSEMLLRLKDRKLWLKQIIFPINDIHGSVMKVMILAQDISQLINQKNRIEVLNIEMSQKIAEIERQNALLIDQSREIEKINEEIRKSNEEIKNINATLESRVLERTKNLEKKNMQLAEYAFINAHLLRGPLCSILGLVNLLEKESKNDDEIVLFHMKKSTLELHDVVAKITRAIEDGGHFDRKLLTEN